MVKAPAKVNLFLEVTGRRPDGYNEIQTVMHTVSLYDILRFKITRKKIEVNPYIPRNTVTSAVNKVFKYCKIKQGISIKIEKLIPVGAGLGGGSSDAGVTINALDKLFKLRLGLEDKLNIAAQVGSDSAFFIRGGTALCLSRGDLVIPIRANRKFNFVLVTFPSSLLTKDVYRAFSLTVRRPQMTHSNFGQFAESVKSPSSGTYRATMSNVKRPLTVKPEHTQSESFGLIQPCPEHVERQGYEVAEGLTRPFKDVIRFIKLLNNDLSKLGKGLFNRLESSAIGIKPEILTVKRKMEQLNFIGVCLSGSGPSLFGLCESFRDAQTKARILKNELRDCIVYCITSDKS